jgi:hypothetical protein
MWTTVRGLGNVICYLYSASEGDPAAVITLSYVQVDCRAATRPRAYQLADQVRRRLKAMVWEQFPEVIISAVDCTDGPRWLPDGDGAPRYIARYTVGHHPRQGLLKGE